MKDIMTQIKLEASKRLRASTQLECGCETEAVCAHTVSALTDKQKKLDINKNGKIDGDDLKKVREGETAEATMLSAATPREAAQYVVKVFKRNGLRIKFLADISTDTTLLFRVEVVSGLTAGFELQLIGGRVKFDSSADMFDPYKALSKLMGVKDPRLTFSQNGVVDFRKWEASVVKMMERAGDALEAYQTFAALFASAMSEITAEMQKGRGKGSK
jgi:hypothetical protein